MGQAKQRGTFEQRQAEGIAKRQEQERKRAEELAALKAERAEREARKTPEERDRSRRASLLLASVLGTVVASSTTRGLEFARIADEYRAANASLSGATLAARPLEASVSHHGQKG